VRSEIPIVVFVKIKIFWDVILCCWASRSRHLNWLLYLRIQSQAIELCCLTTNIKT